MKSWDDRVERLEKGAKSEDDIAWEWLLTVPRTIRNNIEILQSNIAYTEGLIENMGGKSEFWNRANWEPYLSEQSTELQRNIDKLPEVERQERELVDYLGASE
ncbi:MAG TPA: hypothetical protein VJP79_11725 [Nitrososphaera sp.]|nr:hypothetical protein [Nitrososphaera sp.]